MASLFDQEQADLDVQFAEFHAAHPEVYQELVRMARQLVAKGHRHLGIAMLWETLRYHTMLGDPDAEYRLNNSLRSRFARLIMDSERDLVGIFETRSLAAERAA